MSISKSKIWIGGGAAVCVLILVASWFLLIQPKRAEAADLRLQTSSTQTANEQSRAKIAQLKAQFATLPAKRAELAKVREAMPAEYAEATLVRDLQKLATGTGTTFVSITSADPVPFNLAPTATATASTASASPTTAATPAPAAGAQANVSSMQVVVEVQSTFAGSQAFLQKVQDTMPRAFLITNLKISATETKEAEKGKPATKNGDVLMTLTGQVFMLAVPEEAASGSVPSSPTTAVPTPASTAVAN